MKNSTINRGVIRKVARALGDLNQQVIYVGGAVVTLYVDDPAADDVRPTKDIDISLSIASFGELEEIREQMIQRGFIQSALDSVICRFRFEDVLVDVMNTSAIGWAPANPWFLPGFQKKMQVHVEDIVINVLPLPYFMASKFAAYHSRGNNEPRTSQDFEDIVYLLDNCTNLAEVITGSEPPVSAFLKTEFNQIMIDGVKQEAILGNLFYETRMERYVRILQKLKQISANPH